MCDTKGRLGVGGHEWEDGQDEEDGVENMQR